MNLKEIQELIRIFSKSNLGELKIKQEGFKIKLKCIEGTIKHSVSSPNFQSIPQPIYETTPIISNEVVEKPSNNTKPSSEEQANSNQKIIKAPMIGTFYRSAGPDKEPFVKVGDTISEGSTLCIIEAMKLFNEVESEVSGTIVKILVNDSTPVEYDQPLFIVE